MRLPLPQGACWLLPAAAAADVAHNYLSHTLVLHRHKILGRTTRLQARLRSSRPCSMRCNPSAPGAAAVGTDFAKELRSSSGGSVRHTSFGRKLPLDV